MPITAASNINELVDELVKLEEAQQKIYDVYRKAAELDLDFKELKEKEKRTRMFIAIKTGR